MIPRPRIAGVVLIFIILATFLFHGRSTIHERFKSAAAANAPVDKSQTQEHGEKVTNARPPASPPSACPNQLEWLHELGDSPDVTFPLKYARRDIVVRPKPGIERASVTKLDENLLPEFQEISSPDGCELKEEHHMPPFHLDVPTFLKHIDASHILFGAATTLDRLDASIPFFQRWLANTGARLFVVVTGNDDAAPNPQAMEDLQARVRELGMLVTLVKPLRSKDTNIERFFSLIRVLNENRDEKTRWFGFIDDDTFFTSMSALVSRLGEFDYQKRWYLGAVSEEWWTVVQYGWIAMGWWSRFSLKSRRLIVQQAVVGFSSLLQWSRRSTPITMIVRRPPTPASATTESPSASTKQPITDSPSSRDFTKLTFMVRSRLQCSYS